MLFKSQGLQYFIMTTQAKTDFGAGKCGVPVIINKTCGIE